VTICGVCAMPLDPIVADEGSHPACLFSGLLPAPIHDGLIALLARRLGAVEVASATTEEICMTDPRSSANREDALR